MKSLILSAYDRSNGSARAAYRLHQGLLQVGTQSEMLVQEKGTNNPHVFAPRSRLAQGVAKARVTLDSLPLKFYRQREPSLLSIQWLPDKINSAIQKINPDIVNLHWISEGFCQLETLRRIQQPIVWSLHDMWAFTGGCHYTQGCDRFLEQCGTCPQLGSQSNYDLTRWVWSRKRKVMQKANLTIVALSHWLAATARNSSILQDVPIEVIPNGIDTDIYHPIESKIARNLLGLPLDKTLILFGAINSTSDKRKGFQFLKSALNELRSSHFCDALELVVLGAERPHSPLDLGFKVHYLGSLFDDLSLALTYSAADLFVAPSIQENLANTVMESLACGTPVLAFNIGGMPDMIEHLQNGFLAEPFDVADLAQGIIWTLESPERHRQLSIRARQKVEQEFTLTIQSSRYCNLFDQLLEQRKVDVIKRPKNYSTI